MVVVNDGSSDNTALEVKQMAKELPVTLLEHEKNQGLGRAIRTGLIYIINKASDEDIIVTSEADGTMKTVKLIKLVQAVQGSADLAVATPFIGEGFINVPFYRRFLSRGANLLYEVLFPMKDLHDYTNLARAFKAPILKKALNTYGDQFLTLTGFEAVPDIILKLRPFKPKVVEIPSEIDFTNKKKKSTMPIVKTILMSLALCGTHLFSKKSVS